jgi:hypothetical protein
MGLASFLRATVAPTIVKAEMPERKTCRKPPARSENEARPNVGINIGHSTSYLVSSGLGRYLRHRRNDER